MYQNKNTKTMAETTGPAAVAGPVVSAIPFLCRILHTDLVQQVGMSVEQAQELVERLPPAGFRPPHICKRFGYRQKISPASF